MTAHEPPKTFGRIQEGLLVSLIALVGATFLVLALSALLPSSVWQSVFSRCGVDDLENAFLFGIVMNVIASACALGSAFTRSATRRRALLIGAWTIAVVLLTVAGNFCWELKDGCGPFSGRSTGITAVSKFAGAMWFPYGVIVIFPVVCTLWSRRLHDEKNI